MDQQPEYPPRNRKMKCWAMTAMTVTAPRAPQTTQSPDMFPVGRATKTVATDNRARME